MLRSIKQLMQHSGAASADNCSPWIREDMRYFFLVRIRTTCEKLAINFTHCNKNSRNVTQVPRGRFNNRELIWPWARYVLRECPKPGSLLSVCVNMDDLNVLLCAKYENFTEYVILPAAILFGRRFADCLCNDKRHWTIGQEIYNCFTKSWDFFASLQFETMAPERVRIFT